MFDKFGAFICLPDPIIVIVIVADSVVVYLNDCLCRCVSVGCASVYVNDCLSTF